MEKIETDKIINDENKLINTTDLPETFSSNHNPSIQTTDATRSVLKPPI
nr:hypothetical protein [Legionella tunisiensis]